MVPEAQAINNRLLNDSSYWSKAHWEFDLLSNEVERINNVFEFRPFQYLEQLNTSYYTRRVGNQLANYLKEAKRYFVGRYLKSQEKRDSIYNSLVAQLGKEEFVKLEKKIPQRVFG